MKLVVILHNIRSVHNVGSIFRTADGAGVEKIYLCGITPTPLDRFGKVRPDFAKVALGAQETVAWEAARSTASVVKKLKKNGWQIFALEQAKNSVPYDATGIVGAADGASSVEPRIALILGDEVRGVSPALLKLADTIIEIPMRGTKESLNVSVAFGIAAFRLLA